jgi:hypothetical protein
MEIPIERGMWGPCQRQLLAFRRTKVRRVTVTAAAGLTMALAVSPPDAVTPALTVTALTISARKKSSI